MPRNTQEGYLPLRLEHQFRKGRLLSNPNLAHNSHKAPRPWLAKCSAETTRYPLLLARLRSASRVLCKNACGNTMLLRASETRRIYCAMPRRLMALPFLIAVQVTPVADLQNPSVRHGHILVEEVCNASAPAKKGASHSLPGASRLQWELTRCVNDLHRSLQRNQPNAQVAALDSPASSGSATPAYHPGVWADTRVDVLDQSRVKAVSAYSSWSASSTLLQRRG